MSRLALWTAVGVALAGVERLIPPVIPWVRLGLANAAALIVLFVHGWLPALAVNLLRVVVVAALFGTWASPAFLLSASGALAAVLLMAGAKRAVRTLSPVGVSAVGGFGHIAAQFLVVSLVLVRHRGLLALAGPSLAAGVLSGALVGLLVRQALPRLPRGRAL